MGHSEPTLRSGRQCSALRGNGKRSQGVKKQQPQVPVRVSVHSEETQHLQERAVCKDRSAKHRQPFLFPTGNTCSKEKPPADLESHRKRKRSQIPSPQSKSEEIERLFSLETSPKSLDKQEKRRRIAERRQSPGPQRRSRRLQEKQRQQTSRISGRINTPPSTSASSCQDNEYPRDLTVFEKPSDSRRKRKRLQEAEDPVLYDSAEPSQKRSRTALASSAVEDTSKQEAGNNVGENSNPVNHWIQEGSWPKQYFNQDNRTKEGLEKYICLENYLIEQKTSMAHLLARKKSSASLSRKNSESSMETPSDQQLREEKSAPYKHPSYEILLATKGSHMNESKLGITSASKRDIQTLLDTETGVPNDSLFSDDQFQATCEKIRNRNEARITRDISLLLVPSAEILETQGATHLEHLIDSVNEGWNNSIPATKPRPQPDFSVGFRRSAFTDDQLKRLEPFVGGFNETSFYMATWQMYFPFLTCELKCGAVGLDIADRQNAHSMTLAVRGVVELFRYVKREKEIHQEILAFSISHDHGSVRIYGHYALINGIETTFYRHPIDEFFLTARDGKDKWTTYKFTKNVYDIWMPAHLKRICSAIDQFPANIDFGVSLFTSNASESEPPDLQETAISAPSSQNAVEFRKPELPKKQKLTTNAMLQQEIERFRQERVEEREQREQEMNWLKEQLKQRDEQLKQRDEQLKQQGDKLDRLTNMMEQRLL